MSSVHDYTAKTIDGEEKSLADFRGQVLLVVNVASKCGFTPQYRGLQSLYEKRRDQGFSVLGFPCDQFGHQEPGDEAQIKDFCSTTYQVTFPMFAKIKVNGEQTHPLYKHLKHESPGVLGEAIKWNFTKFLVSREGKVVGRYAPNDTPEKIEKDLVQLLSEKSS